MRTGPGVHFLDAAAPEGMRLYAIGDVHGRFDLLREMHARIRGEIVRDRPADWRIIHVGDYVDRGPQSREVIELLLELTRSDPHVVALAERDLARKWGVVFTPTLIFLAKDAEPAGKAANQSAAATMPGYFKPFHFASMFDYVASDAYKDRHFQEFIVARAEKLRSEGVDVKIWD